MGAPRPKPPRLKAPGGRWQVDLAYCDHQEVRQNRCGKCKEQTAALGVRLAAYLGAFESALKYTKVKLTPSMVLERF